MTHFITHSGKCQAWLKKQLRRGEGWKRGRFKDEKIYCKNRKDIYELFRRLLLVAKSILVPAVRALPGDAIAGHAPYVFTHTSLADIEAAATAPAEAKFFAATVASIAALSATSAPVGEGWC